MTEEGQTTEKQLYTTDIKWPDPFHLDKGNVPIRSAKDRKEPEMRWIESHDYDEAMRIGGGVNNNKTERERVWNRE